VRFYLGTGMPGWLATVRVQLFVSHRRQSISARPLRTQGGTTTNVVQHPASAQDNAHT
jgi:hypothetical protein